LSGVVSFLDFHGINEMIIYLPRKKNKERIDGLELR